MRDRIIKFLTAENKSSAQFAEEIGVQPSGVSHILSGRNNPSLDFVIKMLTRYSYISTEWLLFGREPIYKGLTQPTLFDVPEGDNSETNQPAGGENYESTVPKAENRGISEGKSDTRDRSVHEKREIDRIVFFYADNSFEEFTPGGKV